MSEMKVVSRGELGHRLTLSNMRMEGEHYHPSYIWSADKNCWPGDWEGRTILALVSLANATGKEPAYLEDIMDLLESHLNPNGYIGEIENGFFSEQQLAGNSWLLRGLIEYTKLKNSERSIDVIKRIVNNLYLPLTDIINEYPLKKISKDGNYSGSVAVTYKSWKMSKDIGCIYISLDGITSAYEFLKDSRLIPLIDNIIKRFKKTDIVEQGFQTHATLSCLRGVIRAYQTIGNKEYLEIAIKCFDKYLQYGLTENYENRNFFNTHKWTEPCAIIDSYICCIELFKLTNDSKYLELAQRIYFNGICRVQLPNGGFALDECLGFEPIDRLSFKEEPDGQPIEAYWCCTMRGAAGLSYVHQNQCVKVDGKYKFINYFDCSVVDEDVEIKVKSYYPYEGKVKLYIKNPNNKQIQLSLFVPKNATNVKCFKNGISSEIDLSNGFIDLVLFERESEVLLSFDIGMEIKPAFTGNNNEKYFVFWHGNLMLGTVDDSLIDNQEKPLYIGNGKYKYGKAVLSHIGDTINQSAESINKPIIILFKK